MSCISNAAFCRALLILCDFFVNLDQFRGLFEVFTEKQGTPPTRSAHAPFTINGEGSLPGCDNG